MMHGLILAGGEGSRLAASGVANPKAVMELGGRPHVQRLVRTLWRLGCDTVTCAVREDLAELVAAAVDDPRVSMVPVRTPTSLHTLDAGLRAIPDGVVLCTLVDTVMPNADWDASHAAAIRALASAAAVVAVTPFVEDEAPLWADVSADDVVAAFGRRGTRPLVTGGVYWLNSSARSVAADAVNAGVQRLRGFLARLVDSGLVVRAVEVERIVDVDTAADLRAALALVGGIES